MTATITLADRRLPLPVHDETQLRHIVTAVATGANVTFRVPRPSPDGRRRLVVFTTADVTGVNANGVDLTDLPDPASVLAVTA